MFNSNTNWDNSLSTGHISTHLGSYELARTGFFTFIVSDLEYLIKATVAKDKPGDKDAQGRYINYSDEEQISGADEVLRLNVTKADIPHFSVQPLEYRRGNEVVKLAGVPTFESGSITVDDVVGMDTKSVLMAWQGLVYDVKTRKGGRMKDYKKDCTLIEYTQDYEEIRRWTLYGCWISSLKENGFDKTADGQREITVSIEYDRAEMEIPQTENA